MRALDPERVEHPDAVVGPDLEVVVLLGLLGLPVAALVVVDAPELALSSGVAGPKLKWPNPEPWIWSIGSPSPVI